MSRTKVIPPKRQARLLARETRLSVYTAGIWLALNEKAEYRKAMGELGRKFGLKLKALCDKNPKRKTELIATYKDELSYWGYGGLLE